MLLAYVKKIHAEAKLSAATGPTPFGTLSNVTLYTERRFAEIDGIGTVEIDATGDMSGLSPVERCQARNGEIEWVPLNKLRNFRTSFFGAGTKSGKKGDD